MRDQQRRGAKRLARTFLRKSCQGHMPSLSQIFDSPRAVRKALTTTDEFFRYCEFSSASLEGGNFDGVFVSCAFKNIEWYWGLFNLAILIDCKFENCTFRGTLFSGCRIIECSFKSCHFLRDNLNRACEAVEASVYGCSAEDCQGFHALFAKHVP